MKTIFLLAGFYFSIVGYSQSGDSIFFQLFSQAGDSMAAYKYNKAIALLDSCIKINKSDANLYNMRGCATIYQDAINDEKNNKTAIQFFNKAIQTDSTDYRYYVNRGWAWQNLDKYANSLKDYKKALSLDTNNVELHGHVLRSLWIQNKNKEAYAYSNKIIRQFPNDGYAYYVRGQLKRDYLHKYPEGNKDIKIAEELRWERGFNLYY
ncbi:MAG TPA: tetratricopeptide repeat protein [Chitinophagaceae bacterium]|nr:tetratricopeptide repeat protein [Chitinophagaceae bacterium]